MKNGQLKPDYNIQVASIIIQCDDCYTDWQEVRFNFSHYSRRTDRSTGQIRNFKVYIADEFQAREKNWQSCLKHRAAGYV